MQEGNSMGIITTFKKPTLERSHGGGLLRLCHKICVVMQGYMSKGLHQCLMAPTECLAVRSQLPGLLLQVTTGHARAAGECAPEADGLPGVAVVLDHRMWRHDECHGHAP